MREILFRGKRIDNSEWVEGFYSNIQEIEHYILMPIALGLLHCQVIPETIAQFTGLCDKNGNKIFEGDTIRWGMFSGSEECFHRHAVVQMDPDIQFKIIHYVDAETGKIKEGDGYVFRFGRFAYKHTDKHVEITGNIHEIKHHGKSKP